MKSGAGIAVIAGGGLLLLALASSKPKGGIGPTPKKNEVLANQKAVVKYDDDGRIVAIPHKEVSSLDNRLILRAVNPVTGAITTYKLNASDLSDAQLRAISDNRFYVDPATNTLKYGLFEGRTVSADWTDLRRVNKEFNNPRDLISSTGKAFVVDQAILKGIGMSDITDEQIKELIRIARDNGLEPRYGSKDSITGWAVSKKRNVDKKHTQELLSFFRGNITSRRAKDLANNGTILLDPYIQDAIARRQSSQIKSGQPIQVPILQDIDGTKYTLPRRPQPRTGAVKDVAGGTWQERIGSQKQWRVVNIGGKYYRQNISSTQRLKASQRNSRYAGSVLKR